MEVWPFLISRSRDVDYQVILSPDFLVSANRDQLLRKILGAKAQELTSQLKWERVEESGFEKLRIVYKTEVAEVAGNELRDRAGRRILRVYGLVFQDPSPNTDERLVLSLFSKACETWESALVSFWKDNREREAIPSVSLISPMPEPDWLWKGTAVSAVAALAVSILVNLWFVLEIKNKEREIARLNAAAAQNLGEPKPPVEQPNLQTGEPPLK